MISSSRLKYYSSLLIKKFRDEENKFIAEGAKIVQEGLESNYLCEIIFVRNDFNEDDNSLQKIITNKGIETAYLTSKEFDKISDSRTPQGISAVFHKPKDHSLNKITADAIVALDAISDPGNVGTILRNSDWFGIKKIIIGDGTADIFNPKTIRSSMGSLFHLDIIYATDFPETLLSLKKSGFKILTAHLKGAELFGLTFPKKVIFVFSSEAHGPSDAILQISDDIIVIPGYGKAESLNVASASAVILSRYAEKS